MISAWRSIPILRGKGRPNLLIVMVDQCRADQGHKSSIYAFFERNLGPDLEELRKLWREFCGLTGVGVVGPPLEAAKE